MAKRGKIVNVLSLKRLKLIEMTCLGCGGTATLYCYPLPNGTLFCKACSPAWLESFVQFAIANGQE